MSELITINELRNFDPENINGNTTILIGRNTGDNNIISSRRIKISKIFQYFKNKRSYITLQITNDGRIYFMEINEESKEFSPELLDIWNKIIISISELLDFRLYSIIVYMLRINRQYLLKYNKLPDNKTQLLALLEFINLLNVQKASTESLIRSIIEANTIPEVVEPQQPNQEERTILVPLGPEEVPIRPLQQPFDDGLLRRINERLERDEDFIRYQRQFNEQLRERQRNIERQINPQQRDVIRNIENLDGYLQNLSRSDAGIRQLLNLINPNTSRSSLLWIIFLTGEIISNLINTAVNIIGFLGRLTPIGSAIRTTNEVLSGESNSSLLFIGGALIILLMVLSFSSKDKKTEINVSSKAKAKSSI